MIQEKFAGKFCRIATRGQEQFLSGKILQFIDDRTEAPNVKCLAPKQSNLYLK